MSAISAADMVLANPGIIVPGRPSWNCLLCHRPWPSPDAKADLDTQYARFPSGLAIYMASVLYDAVEDLPEPTPADLYERFLAWIRPG